MKRQIELELKNLSETGEIEGYASTFGNEDAYGDVVAKGAFISSIAKKNPVLLWQHDTRQPIGTITDLYEDDHGLYFKAQLLVDKVQKATEAYELLKVKAINGISIGFCVKDYEIKDGIRILKSIDLWEISLVTFPANDKAEVTGVKDMSIREIEGCLRDLGLTPSNAKGVISRIKNLRDVDETKESAKKLLQIMKGE